MGESPSRAANWRICILFSLIGVLCGCEPSYHVAPADEFSSKYSWAWPVDTLGPYVFTIKLGEDESVIRVDSSDFLRGSVTSSYYSKAGAPRDWSLVPGLRIDSVKLGFAGDQPGLFFTFHEYPASFRTDDSCFFSGPGIRLNPLALPDDQVPLAYTVVASLSQSGTDSVLTRRVYHHTLKSDGQPGARMRNIASSYRWPFGPTNLISYEVPDSCAVNCVVYNVTGQAVDTLVDEVLPPGLYQVNLYDINMPSGVFFAKWIICGATETKKLLFLR